MKALEEISRDNAAQVGKDLVAWDMGRMLLRRIYSDLNDTLITTRHIALREEQQGARNIADQARRVLGSIESALAAVGDLEALYVKDRR